jgi:hypothetical protein
MEITFKAEPEEMAQMIREFHELVSLQKREKAAFWHELLIEVNGVVMPNVLEALSKKRSAPDLQATEK